MLRRVLIGAAALVALAAAPAAAQYNPTVVQPASVVAGGVITVTGETCLPNQDITVMVKPYDPALEPVKSHRAVGTDPNPGPQGHGDPIATVQVTSDAQGKFTVQIQIPAGTTPGQYVVTSDDGCVQGTLITVLPAQVNQGGGNGSGTLSRTGSDIDKMGMTGAGLLVLGGLILIATKRRRHEAAAPAA
jgi:LPXTG-motif cell wall-anchored protein